MVWKFFWDDKPVPMSRDEQFVRRLIEKVRIFDENVIVDFKSGLDIQVNR